MKSLLLKKLLLHIQMILFNVHKKKYFVLLLNFGFGDREGNIC